MSLRFEQVLPVVLTFLGQISGSPESPNVFIVESQARMNFVTVAVARSFNWHCAICGIRKLVGLRIAADKTKMRKLQNANGRLIACRTVNRVAELGLTFFDNGNYFQGKIF